MEVDLEFSMVQTCSKIIEPVNIVTKFQLRSILLGLIMATIACAIDETMIANAYSEIARDLNGESLKDWIPNIYLLAITSGQLVYGKFSDIFGRRMMISFALMCFTLGSVGVICAPSMSFAVGMRCLTAIGSTGLFSMPFIILADVLPLEQRGGYFGIIGFVYAFANAVGPIVGGVIVDNYNWRWIFSISITMAVIAIVLLVLFVPKSKSSGSFTTQIMRIDLPGTILLVLGITGFVLGINWGDNPYDWSSVNVIAPMITGFVILLAFAFYEVNVAKEPVLSFHIFNFNVICASLATLFTCYAFFVYMYLWPTFLTEVRHVSSLQSGIESLPMLLGVCVGSLLCGYAIDYTGMCRALIRLGMIMLIFGTGMLFRLDITKSPIEETIYHLFNGLGIGINIQATIVVSQAALDESDVAIVSALSSFVLAMGGVFGFAIQHAIIHTVSAATLNNYHLNLPSREELAQLTGYRIGFLSMLPILAIGLICSLLLRPVSLTRP